MPFTIWTIYCRPTDYPHNYVLRGWDILPSGKANPQTVAYVGHSLDEVRSKLPPGSVHFPRDPADDPAICESWI